MRVAGANAGKVIELKLDERTQKALVEVEITEKGFGSLRSDVVLRVAPAVADRRVLPGLPAGHGEEGAAARQPGAGEADRVHDPAGPDPEHHAAALSRALPPDRERVRRRAGGPARGSERGHPAGRAGPAPDVAPAAGAGRPRHGDPPAGDRRGHGAQAAVRQPQERRPVRSGGARHLHRIGGAGRRHPTNFRKLPDFLEQLTPTMAALGEVATEQRPVLVDLNASARELTRFFDDTAELSTASRPAVRALGDAAGPGRQAVRAARPQIKELRRFARRTPDLAPQPAVRARGLRRPESRGGVRPAQPERQGLLRHAGAASLRVQPVAHDQRLRRARLHGPRRRAHRQVRALRGRRARQGPRPQGVPRVARAQPAGRDHPRPVGCAHDGGAGGRRAGAVLAGIASRNGAAAARPRPRRPPARPPRGRPSRARASCRPSSSACWTTCSACPESSRSRSSRPTPSPSSTSSSAHDPPAQHLSRREPGPGRCRDRAGHRGRRLPGLQREQRAAVRPVARRARAGRELRSAHRRARRCARAACGSGS